MNLQGQLKRTSEKTREKDDFRCSNCYSAQARRCGVPVVVQGVGVLTQSRQEKKDKDKAADLTLATDQLSSLPSKMLNMVS